jgi:hypothetical protein
MPLVLVGRRTPVARFHLDVERQVPALCSSYMHRYRKMNVRHAGLHSLGLQLGSGDNVAFSTVRDSVRVARVWIARQRLMIEPSEKRALVTVLSPRLCKTFAIHVDIKCFHVNATTRNTAQSTPGMAMQKTAMISSLLMRNLFRSTDFAGHAVTSPAHMVADATERYSELGSYEKLLLAPS